MVSETLDQINTSFVCIPVCCNLENLIDMKCEALVLVFHIIKKKEGEERRRGRGKKEEKEGGGSSKVGEIECPAIERQSGRTAMGRVNGEGEGREEIQEGSAKVEFEKSRPIGKCQGISGATLAWNLHEFQLAEM